MTLPLVAFQIASDPHRALQIGVDASRAFKTPRTGTERYAWEILRHLLALPQARHHAWQLFVDRPLDPGEIAEFLPISPPTPPSTSPSNSPSFEPPANLTWQVLPWRRMWTHRVLGPAARRAQLDVLFVPSHVIPLVWPRVWPLMWPRYRNPPTVVTVHDLGYRYWPHTHPTTQRLYLDLSTRWNLWAARHIISVSRATAQDLTTLYGVPPARMTVIHEAATSAGRLSTAMPATVDNTAIDTAINAARAEFDLPGEYGIFTGTLHPRKNIERLLRAYARLVRTQGVSWPLVLAGAGGWQVERLHALAHALDVDAQVRFLGYVDQSTLPGLVAGARFFAFPSLFEGFGLPVLEAQALGVPVMTSNYSSLPEVAGDAALYVDPTDVDAIADAMLRLSQDEALRQRLIAAGYANVQRFSWEKAAAETFAVLQAAADKQSNKL